VIACALVDFLLVVVVLIDVLLIAKGSSDANVTLTRGEDRN
jgi:hypothetical protein